MEQDTRITAKLVGIVSLIVFLVVATIFAITTVDAGTVGVVKRFGEVTPITLNPGFHVVTPFVDSVMTYNTKKVTYETSLEEQQKTSEANYKDYPVDTNTEDGQPVDIAYTVRFSVDPTKAQWIAQNIGNEDNLVEKVVKTESRVWARNIPRGYSAEKLYTGEGSTQVQNEIFDHLKESFSANGLILDFFGIREITFEPEYVNAIREKQQAEVMIQTEANKAQQEKFRKEQRITAAEASAREQELQRTTISDELLEKMWIEKWSGVLPTIMLGDNASPLIQLPQ